MKCVLDFDMSQCGRSISLVARLSRCAPTVMGEFDALLPGALWPGVPYPLTEPRIVKNDEVRRSDGILKTVVETLTSLRR